MALASFDQARRVLKAGWLLALVLAAAEFVAFGVAWSSPESAYHVWALLAALLALASALLAGASTGRGGGWLLPVPLWAGLAYLAQPVDSTTRLALMPPALHMAGIVFMYLVPLVGTAAAVHVLTRGFGWESHQHRAPLA